MSKKADKIPDYPPRIFITCTGGGAEEAELMTLSVTGLDEECNFEIPIPTIPSIPNWLLLKLTWLKFNILHFACI